ncbi:MAG: hypothetical protein LBF15_02070 [Candidatus Peribacteria bacterium]|jgi:hypothetical protein|nr:hypothetical protein [Candidatus Peribacteria bacterium]
MLSLEERIGNLSREASEIHRSLYMVSGFAKEFGIESGELQAVDEIDRSIAEISAKVKDLNERVIGNRIKESRGEVIIKDTKVMK